MADAEDRRTWTPHHCPTCRCEPTGHLPPGVAVDPYCPEHGTLPTAYPACSCRTTGAHTTLAFIPDTDDSSERQEA